MSNTQMHTYLLLIQLNDKIASWLSKQGHLPGPIRLYGLYLDCAIQGVLVSSGESRAKRGHTLDTQTTADNNHVSKARLPQTSQRCDLKL
jgi:hypothetical protein